MTAFIGILLAILMGIIQGITEWLPISSTAHLLLLRDILPADVSALFFEESFFNVFKVVIQLGSILAVLLLFWNKLNPFSEKKNAAQKKGTLSLWGKVLIASIPAAIAGFLLDDIVDTYLSTPLFIAIMLILYGVLFIVMDKLLPKPRIRRFEDINWKTALLFGVGQMLAALFPGTSRSGATISAGLLLGCSRYTATEFSFFMAIPVMVGASGYKLLKYFINLLQHEVTAFNALQWTMMILAFIVAFIVSVFAIRFLMNFVKKHTFKVFGYYRIVLAILVIAILVIPSWFAAAPAV